MKMSKYKKNEAFWGYVFVSAPVLQFLIFLVVPLGISFWLSFHSWDMLTPTKSVGLKNYTDLMNDEKFWKALWNTVYLMIGIPLGMILSLALAMLMNRKIRGVSLLRAMYYIPAICSIIAAAQMWLWVFNADNGLINTLLWNWFHVRGPYWFGDSRFTKIPMIVMGIWSGMGPTMIFFLAGLQNIPKSFYEAAEVDGANGWEKFVYITIPKLTPTIFFLLIMGIIGGLQSMAQTYVMYPAGTNGAGGGGPEYSAATILYYLWESAFKYNQMGYASAMAWIVGIIIFIMTFINFKLSSKWVSYD